jgi:hypothetical protein
VRRPLRKALPVAAGLLILACATATTYRELTLAEVITAAELAFQGTVASVTTVVRDGEPWTIVEFELERLLAGPERDGEPVTLAFLGGDAPGGAGLFVHLMPTFTVGESVTVLAYEEPYYSPVVGFNQGLWRLRDGAWHDEMGRMLGLDDQGRLVQDETGGDPDLVIDALERRLESRQ